MTEPQSLGTSRALAGYVGVLVAAETALATVLIPLLPHYAQLAGLSKSGAGILMAADPAGSLIGSLPGGVITGRLGPRATVMLGLAAEAGACLAFGWSSAAAALVITRFVMGAAGACVWAAGLAWLAGATPAKQRGETLGVAMGFAAAGALAGPAIGAFASWAGPGPVFSAAAAVNVILIGAAAFLPRPRGSGARRLLPSPRVLRDRRVSTGVMLTMLGGIALGGLDVLAPLRLSALGASALVIAGTFVVAGVGEVALSPWAGRLSDRRGPAAPARLLLATGAAVGLGFPLLGLAGLVVLLAVGVPAYGSLGVPGSALLSAGADRLGLHQGAAFGLENLAWTGGQAAAAAAAGAAAQATSEMVPTAVIAGLCLVTLAALSPGSPLASGAQRTEMAGDS